MSYSSDMYSNIFADIKIRKEPNKSRVSRRKQMDNGIAVVYSVNTRNLTRELYIEVGSNPYPKKSDFPHWKGTDIGFAQLSEYSDEQTYYLSLWQLPESAGYIFEIVVEDLRTALDQLKDKAERLELTKSVLFKWKKFFLMDRDVRMTPERQQGLFGELLMLQELVETYGAVSINHWAGSNDETHDFYIKSHSVEVKTTSAKAPYKIHISSEYQLDDTDVIGNLFLRFYALRKSESDGQKLPDRIQMIEDQLKEFPVYLEQFHEKLEKYGYINAGMDLYTTGFLVREERTYAVKDNFPRIISSDLKRGTANLTYTVNIDTCHKHEIVNEKFYSFLNGETCYAERENS